MSGHEGGRNLIFRCARNGENLYILRVSALGDRTEEAYLAETEFVRYLAQNGAPVADVLPSIHGRYVERVDRDGQAAYISLFQYAKGILISDNGYRYREGAPLSEYFYNTGKALGAIHRLSKGYSPAHRRTDFFSRYGKAYLDALIPDTFANLREAIFQRLDAFRALPADKSAWGLVHFDFSDGNYHIDMETGAITVFDFDNCLYCWYLFDLANLWLHGTGWCRFEKDPEKRMAFMRDYFETVLRGYRTETDVSPALLDQLPLFIDMVLVENVVDEFECAAREGEEIDPEDIEAPARCLVEGIPFAGVGEGPEAG